MSVSFATTVDEARALLDGVGSPVVVVPVHNAYDDVLQCLESLFEHTPVERAILVVDDRGDDRRFVDVLSAVAGEIIHPVVVLQNEVNLGFVTSCNRAFDSTPGCDVVLVNSDVVVGPEWLQRLEAAADSDDTVATVTTLTNHGSIVSVPERNISTKGLPGGLTAAEAARRVAAHSARTYPPVPTAIGHCCYIRRSALELLGGFDESLSPGYGEEVEFSQRALRHGFRNVLADDVFTYHRGGASFQADPDARARQLRHEELVIARHPWYGDSARASAHDPRSPLGDAIARARQALLGLTVAVDALILGRERTGTQQIVIDTIRALAARKEITRLVVFVSTQPPPYVNELRDELRDVEFIGVNPVLGGPERVVDVVYRPCQIRDIVELDFLHRVGERFVVNQLDTIAYCNPSYFETYDQWAEYRDITRLTLTMAHGVAFLSESGRRSARAEGLLGYSQLTSVVSCGLPTGEPGLDPTPPAALTTTHEGFILVLGASYQHKGRVFALRVWDELRRRGWPGQIVLAGPTPPHGNSLAREAEFLLARPDRRDEVHTIGAVTEGEKRWLYEHAALVLYPSVTEGFGLIPFEAAQHGVATLAARRSSMVETLPDDILTLESFDVGEAADAAWTLLHDPTAAAACVESLRDAGDGYTWDRTGELLVDLFQSALQRPRGRHLVIEGERDFPTGLAARFQRSGTAPVDSLVERVVRSVISRPGLKNGLSPDGSRRQRYARQTISYVRTRAQRSEVPQ